MNKNAAAEPELEIIQSILAEAESKAQRTRDSAKNAIEAEDSKALREREEMARDILAKAAETARKLGSREIATANMEAQRILLKAREEAVDAVVMQIESKLKVLRGNPEMYRSSLAFLAAEAVSAVGEAEVRLYVSSADRPFVDSAFVGSIRSSARDHSGREPVLHIDYRQTDLGGGCIAASLDGRIVFDNTFSRRLERMKTQLRTSIVKEIIANNE